MDILKNKFLLLPLFIFALVFLIDKLFFIPFVRRHTELWKKIEPDFYHSREDLFDQLQKEYPIRQSKGEILGLILGTSRSGEFDSREISRHILNSYTYNFSAPFAGPAFHYFWLNKIIGSGIKINFVIIEADPLIFSPVSLRYSLAYSFDPVFIFRNLDLNKRKRRSTARMGLFIDAGNGFSFDEVETYSLKYIFALYKYPPNFRAIVENNRIHPLLGKSGGEFKKIILSKLNLANQRNLGGIPNLFISQASQKEIEELAREDANIYLQNYKPSPTQSYFFKKIMETLAGQKVKTIIYWPLVPAPFRKIMAELGLVSMMQESLLKQIELLKNRYPGTEMTLADLYDVSTMKCRYFSDSNHLSGKCFKELTQHLLSQQN